MSFLCIYWGYIQLVFVIEYLMMPSFTRTLKFKVRPEAYGWLSAAAMEVNGVYNYCNESSWLAATRTDLKRKWFSGYDLCNLTSGAAQYFERIGADTIQRVCYVARTSFRRTRPTGYFRPELTSQ